MEYSPAGFVFVAVGTPVATLVAVTVAPGYDGSGGIGNNAADGSRSLFALKLDKGAGKEPVPTRTISK